MIGVASSPKLINTCVEYDKEMESEINLRVKSNTKTIAQREFLTIHNTPL